MDSLVSRLQQQRVPFKVNIPFISLLLCKKVKHLTTETPPLLQSFLLKAQATGLVDAVPLQAVKRFVLARVGDTRLVRAAVTGLLQAVRLKPQQQQREVDGQQPNARLDIHSSTHYLGWAAYYSVVLTYVLVLLRGFAYGAASVVERYAEWLTFDTLEAAVTAELQQQQQQQGAGGSRVSVQKSQLIRLLDGLTKHPDHLLATVMKGIRLPCSLFMI